MALNCNLYISAWLEYISASLTSRECYGARALLVRKQGVRLPRKVTAHAPSQIACLLLQRSRPTSPRVRKASSFLIVVDSTL